MKVLLLLFCCCIVIVSSKFMLNEQWLSFKKQHSKRYLSPMEELYRLSVYLANLRRIEEHNARYAAGLVNYTMRMNHFGDLLPEEAMNLLRHVGLLQSKRVGLPYRKPSNSSLPAEVDWRLKGAVTEVKDQGKCGACWAFSATGSVEGQLAQKRGRLVSLSEQQLVDCSRDFGNLGCGGGTMDNAFEYIKATGGLDSEQHYPYTAQAGSCRRNENNVEGSAVSSHVDLPVGDEGALEEAVARVGPVSVGISAANEGFIYYGGGVFNGESCSKTTVDHGVLVVGYGSEGGQDYWIIKNSWGRVWGEQGYMRLARGKGNLCGLVTMASYPLL